MAQSASFQVVQGLAALAALAAGALELLDQLPIGMWIASPCLWVVLGTASILSRRP